MQKPFLIENIRDGAMLASKKSKKTRVTDGNIMNTKQFKIMK